MGFFDTLGGIGRGALAGLEGIASTLLPAFVQAGTGFLINKAFPGQTASLPFGTSPIRFPQGDRPRAPFPGELPFGSQVQRATQQVFQQATFPTPRPTAFPGSIVSRGGQPIPSFPIPAPFPQPGGFPTMPPGPTTRGVAFDIPGIDLQLPFRAQGADPTCPTIFRQGNAVARAVRSFEVMNPVTGNIVFFKNMGRPVLFSGDLAACKRVAKVARRARVSRGRR